MAEFKNELILQDTSGVKVSIDLRNSLVLSSAPTTSTEARQGMQAYVVENNVIAAEYVCTAVSGGVYTWVRLKTDDTLTKSGMAADAKVVGDAISELENTLYEIPENLYKGEVLTGGYYDKTTWVASDKYKMIFLPFDCVRSGDTITYSAGYDYYNGKYRFDIFTEDKIWLAELYVGSDTSFIIKDFSVAKTFKIGLRIRAEKDESKLVIVKGDSLETINKVEEAHNEIKRIEKGILFGKIINCLGDSFTAPQSAWHYFIGERTGCIINNYGVSSSRVSIDITKTNETDENGNPITTVVESFITRSANMDTSADITVIFGGINDAQTIYSGGITLGDIESELNTSTFYGALKLLISNIQTLIPGKKIIGVVPPDYIPYPTSEQYYQTLPQVQKACREVYEYYGIPYADLKLECQEMYLNDYNRATYRRGASNNYHPSDAGYSAISEVIQGALERYIKV